MKPSSSERKYISGEDVEIEIAIGDRRAAYDELSRAANWLAGACFALNGGAIVVLLGRSDLRLVDFGGAITAFAAGLGMILIAAVIASFFTLRLIHDTNRRLDRIPETRDDEKRELRIVRHSFLLVLALAASMWLFGFGTILALDAVEASIGASVGEKTP